jgi:hypothetical protein
MTTPEGTWYPPQGVPYDHPQGSPLAPCKVLIWRDKGLVNGDVVIFDHRAMGVSFMLYPKESS